MEERDKIISEVKINYKVAKGKQTQEHLIRCIEKGRKITKRMKMKREGSKKDQKEINELKEKQRNI